MTHASPLPPGFVAALAAHVGVAEFDVETVLYDAESARPLLLNVSAAAVWAAIDGTRTMAAIAAVVAEQFGVEPGSLYADVALAITRFADLGLLANEVVRNPKN